MHCKKCGNDVPYGVSVCEKCATGSESDMPYKAPTDAVQIPRTSPVGQPNYYQQQSKPNSPLNGLALTSLIISCVSFLFIPIAVITGPLCIIFGIVARNQIKASGNNQQGLGLAIAGIVISGAELIILGVIALIFVVYARNDIRPKTFQPYMRQSKINEEYYSPVIKAEIFTSTDWKTIFGIKS